jgi:hypothetical protein
MKEDRADLCEREPLRRMLADALFPSRMPACERTSASGREGTWGFRRRSWPSKVEGRSNFCTGKGTACEGGGAFIGGARPDRHRDGPHALTDPKVAQQ